MQKAMLILGFHDREAPRQWNINRTFQAEGWALTECHTQRKGLGKLMDLWGQYRHRSREADAVLVTFPGHHLMPFVWLWTRMPRKTLIFDAFISLHDTLVDDRKIVHPASLRAWWLWMLDWLSLHMADDVIIDTEAHKKFLIKEFRVKPDRVRVIYVGSRDDLFTSKNKERATSNEQTKNILFYGTYIPLQGVDVILDAAAIVQQTQPEVHFTLIGSGQTSKAMHQKAKDLGLTNMTFEPRIALHELPDRIRAADVCLGIFGRSAKAQRVIPHKVFDAVACGVPVITADTPAIRERFREGHDVFLCRAGDPESLARAIAAVLQARDAVRV